MRLLAPWKTVRSSWRGIVQPIALVLLGLLLGPMGPAQGESIGPAIWVPATPTTPGGPIVLVPYEQTLTNSGLGSEPQPWIPDYLASPGPGQFGGSMQSGLLPGDLGWTGTGLEGQQSGQPGAASAQGTQTFSDVLRDVDWRRETAERLRAQPEFQPRF